MSDDYATLTVDGVDQRTGYPKDDRGTLLNPHDPWDNSLIEGWDKKGTKLKVLTDPYGTLYFVIGNGDDFLCMDYEVIDSFNGSGKWIVLDASLNSETASFIQRSAYSILPVNTQEEKEVAVNAAIGIMDYAFEDVRHSVKGWGQDVWYWARCVDRALFPELYQAIPRLSERQMRLGGKRVNAVFFGVRRI